MEPGIVKIQLSQRGLTNVTTVMQGVPKTILEAGYVTDEDAIVDLSVTENWLICDEILEIQKGIGTKELLHAEVSHLLGRKRFIFEHNVRGWQALTSELGHSLIAYVMAKRFLGQSTSSGERCKILQRLF